jgi:hypothetical protein
MSGRDADNGYGSLNEGTISRLLRMAEQETAIRLWRDTLTENKRESWNSPTSICNRCPAVRKAIAEANSHKPTRTRKQKAAMLEIENALDVIGDLAFGLKDASQRAVIRERLLAFAKQFGKPGAHVDEDDEEQAPPPNAKPKSKHKRKAATKANDAIEDDDPDPRRDPDFDRGDPVCRDVLASWLKRQAEKRLSDPVKRRRAEATMASILGVLNAAVGVKPKPEPAAKPAAPMLNTPEKDVQTRAMCGPTAMAAVTGLPVSVIRDTVRTVTGKKLRSDGSAHPVMGVSIA